MLGSPTFSGFPAGTSLHSLFSLQWPKTAWNVPFSKAISLTLLFIITYFCLYNIKIYKDCDAFNTIEVWYQMPACFYFRLRLLRHFHRAQPWRNSPLQKSFLFRRWFAIRSLITDSCSEGFIILKGISLPKSLYNTDTAFVLLFNIMTATYATV